MGPFLSVNRQVSWEAAPRGRSEVVFLAYADMSFRFRPEKMVPWRRYFQYRGKTEGGALPFRRGGY